ncbi:MAG: polyketide cyclase / dehydrase and lipid transport [Candidatus Nanopelagicales bacterium]
MPTIDLVDETFVAAERSLLVTDAADPARWREWWPDLDLTVFMDRGPDGLRWNVRGALVGSCELWLEQVADGVLVHYYLRVDPASGSVDVTTRRGARHAARLRAERARRWKRSVWAWKDELERGRSAGSPGRPAPAEGG